MSASVGKKRAAPRPPLTQIETSGSSDHNGMKKDPSKHSEDAANGEHSPETNAEILLKVVLPDQKIDEITISSSTALMDLRMQLCAKYKLSPSNYTLEPVEVTGGRTMPHQPSSTLASISAEVVAIKPKLKEPAKIITPKVVEQTVRLTIKMSRSQQQILRVSPNVPLSRLMPQILEKSGLKKDTHQFLELRHHIQKSMVLDTTRTLDDYKIREVFLADKRVLHEVVQDVSPTQISEKSPQGNPTRTGSEKKGSKLKSFFRRSKKLKHAPALPAEVNNSSSPPSPRSPDLPPEEKPPVSKIANVNESHSKVTDELMTKKKRAAPVKPADGQSEPLHGQVTSAGVKKEKDTHEVSPVEKMAVDTKTEVDESDPVPKNHQVTTPAPKAPPRSRPPAPVARLHATGKKKAPAPPEKPAEEDPPSPRPRPPKPPRNPSIEGEKKAVEKERNDQKASEVVSNGDEAPKADVVLSEEEDGTVLSSPEVRSPDSGKIEKADHIATDDGVQDIVPPADEKHDHDASVSNDEVQEAIADHVEVTELNESVDVVEEAKDSDKDESDKEPDDGANSAASPSPKKEDEIVVEHGIGNEKPVQEPEVDKVELGVGVGEIVANLGAEEPEPVDAQKNTQESKNILIAGAPAALEVEDATSDEDDSQVLADSERIEALATVLSEEEPKPAEASKTEQEEEHVRLENPPITDSVEEETQPLGLEEESREESTRRPLSLDESFDEYDDALLRDGIIQSEKHYDAEFGQKPASEDFDFLSSERQIHEEELADKTKLERAVPAAREVIVLQDDDLPPPPQEMVLSEQVEEKTPKEEEKKDVEEEEEVEDEDETMQEIKKLQEQISRMRKKKAEKEAAAEAARKQPYTIVEEKPVIKSGEVLKTGSKTFTFVPNQLNRTVYEDYESVSHIGINLSQSGEIKGIGAAIEETKTPEKNNLIPDKLEAGVRDNEKPAKVLTPNSSREDKTTPQPENTKDKTDKQTFQKPSFGYVSSASARNKGSGSTAAPKSSSSAPKITPTEQDGPSRRSALPNYYKRFLGLRALQSAVQGDTDKASSTSMEQSPPSVAAKPPSILKKREPLPKDEPVAPPRDTENYTGPDVGSSSNKESMSIQPVHHLPPMPAEGAITPAKNSETYTLNENDLPPPPEEFLTPPPDTAPLPLTEAPEKPTSPTSFPREAPPLAKQSSTGSENAGPIGYSPVSPNYVGLSTAKPFSLSSGAGKPKFRPVSASFRDEVNSLNPDYNSNSNRGMKPGS